MGRRRDGKWGEIVVHMANSSVPVCGAGASTFVLVIPMVRINYG